MRLRLTSLLVCGLLLSACGSDPVTPTPIVIPPASIAGSWSGTMQYTTTTSAGVASPGVAVFLMSLSQAGGAVNGTWSIPTASGTVTGATTNTGSFSGTLTFNAVTNAGNPCTGTWAVSGTETPNTITWTSPGISSGNCTALPTNITVAAQLR